MSISMALAERGSVCWNAFGNGTRRVLLRSYLPSGLCRVSKRGTMGAWQTQEIDVDPATPFVTREDALAWHRQQRDRRPHEWCRDRAISDDAMADLDAAA